MTTDKGAAAALLPYVEVRALVPGGNITEVYSEGFTGQSGSTFLLVPEEDPVIITFYRNGYLKSSITYKFERVGSKYNNVHAIRK